MLLGLRRPTPNPNCRDRSDQLSQGATRLTHAPWAALPAVVDAAGGDPGHSSDNAAIQVVSRSCASCGRFAPAAMKARSQGSELDPTLPILLPECLNLLLLSENQSFDAD
jgi:hypothetical protein